MGRKPRVNLVTLRCPGEAGLILFHQPVRVCFRVSGYRPTRRWVLPSGTEFPACKREKGALPSQFCLHPSSRHSLQEHWRVWYFVQMQRGNLSKTGGKNVKKDNRQTQGRQPAAPTVGAGQLLRAPSGARGRGRTPTHPHSSSTWADFVLHNFISSLCINLILIKR